MKVKDHAEEVDIPEGVTLHIKGSLLTVSKGNVSTSRKFADPKITLKIDGNVLIVNVPICTRREKMQIGTFIAHIENMIQGVIHPYVYKLKICSGHFPMNITLSGKQFTVKNFIGEKIPRVLTIKEGVDVKIEGNDITVSSPDKELAGMTAGAIELLCRRPGFDPRIFQQGIYIIEKAGKPVV